MRQGLGSLLLTGWAVGSASAVLYSLDDCNRVKLGCWQDSKPGDKVPGATGKRVLPYAWCPQGAPVKGQCKTADCKYKGQAAPPCEAAKMTPDVCSAACLEWMGFDTKGAFTLWAGVEWTQECWCGDVEPDILTTHKAPAPGCTAKCDGDKSLTCGGPGGKQGSAIEMIRVECGYIEDGWGFTFLGELAVLAVLYLGIGAGYNAQQHGKRGVEALPNHGAWIELHGLASDGVAFTRRVTLGGGAKAAAAGRSKGAKQTGGGGGGRTNLVAREDGSPKKEKRDGGAKAKDKSEKGEKKSKAKGKTKDRDGGAADGTALAATHD